MIPDKIKELMQKLLDNGFEAYIVGGAVRDYLLNIEPHDYDIFTNATGEQILKIFSNGKVLGGEERQAKILTVIVDDVEISQYRSNGERTETGHSLTEHQSTCDFTINSIAMDIDEIIIDPEDGQEDLKNKTLTFVGNPEDRIAEDSLRILRGLRFMIKYDLTPDLSTNYNINKNKDIFSLPKERIREELIKILSLDFDIEKYTFIMSFVPDINIDLFKDGGEYHNETPYQHLINAFNISVQITSNPLLRLACLLHDIGKGVTRTEEDSEIHFYQHEKVGVEIVEKWMKEYKFSNEDINYVTTLVRLHMYSYLDDPVKKSYVKFFKQLNEANIPIMDYIILLYCDNQGNMAKPRIKFGDFVGGNWLLRKYYEITFDNDSPFTVKELKISGKDLIDLGYKPSPQIGLILNEIYELVISGEIDNTRAGLLYCLKANYGVAKK